MFENGDADEAAARIQTLNRQNFIAVLRTLQQMEDALSAYALSWKGCEYWGRGCDFPA
jgi:hypothetical protein